MGTRTPSIRLVDPMTRREAIIAGFSIALGDFTALRAQAASLRVPLDQWSAVTFQYRGQEVRIPVADIFAALKGSD